MSFRTVKTTYRMTQFKVASGDLTPTLDEVKDFIASQEVIEGCLIESWILHSYDDDGHVIMLFWAPTR